MGVGKSTVGRRCAQRLGRPFVDTDDLVVELAGMPLIQAFGTLGEAGLRDLEEQAVIEAAGSVEPLVIACGGGTVVRSQNTDQLRGTGIVIWLRVPPAILASRVGAGAGRPMLTGNTADALERLAAAREEAYAAAADAIVEAHPGEVGEVASRVLARYEAHG
jgi:shikimate kinase